MNAFAGLLWWLFAAEDDGGPEPPDAIADLAAQAVSHRRISLTWTLPAGATGVKVHRSTSTGFTPGAGNLIATVGAVGSHQSSGLEAETEYFFKAVAFNDEGDANASNEASATTDAAPASTPPGIASRFTRLTEVVT